MITLTSLRRAVAAYLLAHFAGLLPWAVELFSSAGALPDKTVSPLLPLSPNLFLLSDSPVFTLAVIATGMLAAGVLVSSEWAPRLCSVVLLVVWASLFGRNPMIANPSIAYVGWLLLALSVLDDAVDGRRWLRRASGIVLAVGYTYSGLGKLMSPSWRDGSAVETVMGGLLAHAHTVHITAAFVEVAPLLLVIATYLALAWELLFLPLWLIPRLRPALVVSSLGFHLFLLMTLDFADLSVGMLVFHAALLVGSRADQDRAQPSGTTLRSDRTR